MCCKYQHIWKQSRPRGRRKRASATRRINLYVFTILLLTFCYFKKGIIPIICCQSLHFQSNLPGARARLRQGPHSVRRGVRAGLSRSSPTLRQEQRQTYCLGTRLARSTLNYPKLAQRSLRSTWGTSRRRSTSCA